MDSSEVVSQEGGQKSKSALPRPGKLSVEKKAALKSKLQAKKQKKEKNHEALTDELSEPVQRSKREREPTETAEGTEQRVAEDKTADPNPADANGTGDEKTTVEKVDEKDEAVKPTPFQLYKEDARQRGWKDFKLPDYNGFKPDYNDHFETDETACRDVLATIEELRSLVRPNCPEAFGLYDPYYCDGRVASTWKKLGIERIFHENRDFYADIKSKSVPAKYDILVTNPPFSTDHIQRLFEFLVEQKKPFAVLIPDYVATKDWYKKLIETHFQEVGGGVAGDPKEWRAPVRDEATDSLRAFTGVSGGTTVEAGGGTGFLSSALTSAVQEKIGVEPFYLVPKHWYQFEHPEGTGRAQGSHFKCMWYVWLGRRTVEVVSALQCKMPAREDLHGQQPDLDVVHGLQAMARGRHIRVDQRKNPKQRAQLKGQREGGPEGPNAFRFESRGGGSRGAGGRDDNSRRPYGGGEGRGGYGGSQDRQGGGRGGRGGFRGGSGRGGFDRGRGRGRGDTSGRGRGF